MSLPSADTVFATSAPGARTAAVPIRARTACPAVCCAIAISLTPFSLCPNGYLQFTAVQKGQHREKYPFSDEWVYHPLRQVMTKPERVPESDWLGSPAPSPC